MSSSPASSPTSAAMPDLPSQLVRRPEILLDQNCRIGYCENSTSTKTENREGHIVEVSFEIRDPPALSLCFARCHSLIGSQCFAGHAEPRIVSAAGGLVLLYIPFSVDDGRISPSYWDYFVYRAGPGTPSLHLLPGPYPTRSPMKMVAVLPIGDNDGEHYAVVFPAVETEFLELGHYRRRSTLQTYRTDKKAWCTVALPAEDSDTDSAMTRLLAHGAATSVADAGSGLIGWVDLWWGVLLCNVLDDERPTIRFVPVPVPDPWKTPSEWDPPFDFNPRSFRHMTVHDGLIRFTELNYHRGPAFNPKRRDDEGWMATTWTMPISSDFWHDSMTFDTSDLSVAADSSFLHLLPEILDEEKKVTWEKVPSGSPTLSLHDDDIVYIMVGKGLHDPTAFLLAINTRSLTLESCAECSGENMLGLEPSYVPSVLSSYFGLAEGRPTFMLTRNDAAM